MVENREDKIIDLRLALEDLEDALRELELHELIGRVKDIASKAQKELIKP